MKDQEWKEARTFERASREQRYHTRLLPGQLVTVKAEASGQWVVCDIRTPGWPRKLCIRSSRYGAVRVVPRRELQETPLQLTVQLVHGPEVAGKGWSFVCVRPGGEIDSAFRYAADAEITAESILEDAWDHAEHPNRVASIVLSEELQELFPASNEEESHREETD